MQEDRCEHCGRLVIKRLSNGWINHVGDHHLRNVFSDDWGKWSHADAMIDRSAPVHHQIPFKGGPLDGQIHHVLNLSASEVRHETDQGVALYRRACVPSAIYRFEGFE